MTRPKAAATPAPTDAETDLPRPPHGGSFVREADGSLRMVEGAVEIAAAPPADTDKQEG